jgi:hypothetical protein
MRFLQIVQAALTLPAILLVGSLAPAQQDPAIFRPSPTGSAAAAASLTTATAAAAEWPKPAAPADMTGWGSHVQHAMSLLATSTPEHHNTVRILFYGQSIIKQDQWKLVVADLKNRFPNANIVAENRSIGGFASQKLIKTIDRDVMTFKPDLVLFHVAGADNTYEDCIRLMRQRTTADIAMQTDTLGGKADLSIEWKEPKDGKEDWDTHMNRDFIPATAKKYGCELIDIRTAWRRYLIDNKLDPNAVLVDGGHMNAWGCFLMASIVERYLVFDPQAPAENYWGSMKTVEVGKDAKFENGKLSLDFDGNRVDAVLLAGSIKDGGVSQRISTAPVLQILIDGKKPSEIPETYFYSRANDGPGVDWPWGVNAPARIGFEKPPVTEEWTLTMTDGDAMHFKFKAEGSVTGPDGDGSSDEKFVSKSGRVTIEKDDWHKMAVPGKVGAASAIVPGYTWKFRWEVQGVDTLAVPKDKLDPTRETAVTLATGLTNGPHHLEIVTQGEGTVPVKAIRTYKPSMQ